MAFNNEMKGNAMDFDNDCGNEHIDHIVKRKDEPMEAPSEGSNELLEPFMGDADEDILNKRNAEEFRQLLVGKDLDTWIKRESDLADLNDFIATLDSVKNTGSNRWKAKCPAHDDAGQNLTVSISNDEGLVFKCLTGCEIEKIRQALGLGVPSVEAENQPDDDVATELPIADAGESPATPVSGSVELPLAGSGSVKVPKDPETGANIPTTDMTISAPQDVEVFSKSEVVAGQNALLAELMENRLTDQKNAERLVELSEGLFRYWFVGKGWFYFDGQRWVSADHRILRLAKRVSQTFLKEAATEVNEERAEELYKHARYSESAYAINAMMTLAKGESAFQISMDDFNRNKWLINLPTGTYDLANTLFREHLKEDFITRIAPVQYDPKATAPIFEEFIFKIFLGKRDIINFVQRVFGYALSGDCGEQKLFILHGGGRNGKSTLVNAILEVMGDYGIQAPPQLLMASKFDRHPTEIAGLRNARLVVASETSEGRWLNEALVKSLTGQDRITARLMRENFFSFTPEFKIFLTTNHLPNIRCGDFGIQRRLVTIPFGYTVPENEVDPYLPDKLRVETPGIFNWLVAGFNGWKKHGLAVPAEIEELTSDYIKDSDFIQAFLEEKCQFQDHFRAKVADLYIAYKMWAHQTGEPELTQKRFGQLLSAGGYTKINSGGWHWEGLKLINPYAV